MNFTGNTRCDSDVGRQSEIVASRQRDAARIRGDIGVDDQVVRSTQQDTSIGGGGYGVASDYGDVASGIHQDDGAAAGGRESGLRVNGF